MGKTLLGKKNPHSKTRESLYYSTTKIITIQSQNHSGFICKGGRAILYTYKFEKRNAIIKFLNLPPLTLEMPPL